MPLELDAQGPTQFVSIERIPGQAPKYTVQVGTVGFVRVSPHPERAGPSTVYVTCYDVFSNRTAVKGLVLTQAAGDGPTRQHPARRIGAGEFVSRLVLAPGKNTITAVAHTAFGARLRATVELDVPG